MSQQINLLNPDLRPRRDWLSFRIVAPVAAVCIAAVVVAMVLVRSEQSALASREIETGSRLKAAQEQLQALARQVGERVSDPRLVSEAERLAAAVKRHEDALRVLQPAAADGQGGYGEVMRGLARQSMSGLWLTAFAVGSDAMEIRGRMLEPSLLPTYIRRLNGEAAFQGRRFDALDLQGVTPEAVPAGVTGAATGLQSSLPRHTEFALRAGRAGEKPAEAGR